MDDRLVRGSMDKFKMEPKNEAFQEEQLRFLGCYFQCSMAVSLGGGYFVQFFPPKKNHPLLVGGFNPSEKY